MTQRIRRSISSTSAHDQAICHLLSSPAALASGSAARARRRPHHSGWQPDEATGRPATPQPAVALALQPVQPACRPGPPAPGPQATGWPPTR